MYVMFDDTTRGTYDTMLDVFIDVRIGAVDGLIISSTVKNMAVLGVVWDRTAPPKAVKIPGVNHFLSGVDTQHDFWFNGPIDVTDDTFIQVLDHATVPVPAAAWLGLPLLGGIGLMKLRRTRRAA